jgi:hypothetical protein
MTTTSSPAITREYIYWLRLHTQTLRHYAKDVYFHVTSYSNWPANHEGAWPQLKGIQTCCVNLLKGDIWHLIL